MMMMIMMMMMMMMMMMVVVVVVVVVVERIAFVLGQKRVMPFTIYHLPFTLFVPSHEP
jgi:hypothetical protein